MRKTFTEWLIHIRKPTDLELFCKELNTEKECLGGCGVFVKGWVSGQICDKCFNEKVRIKFNQPIIYHE